MKFTPNHNPDRVLHLDGVKIATNDYLLKALNLLKESCREQLAKHFRQEYSSTGYLPTPLNQNDSPFEKFVSYYNLSFDEIIILMTALVPHLLPGFFDTVIQHFLPQGGELPEFGGRKGDHHRGTLPTGETALFILAGADIDKRLKFLPLFDENHTLFKHKILRLGAVKSGEPVMSGMLTLDPDYAEVFTTGHLSQPKLSINFPAQHITTQMTWDDLVLNKQTIDQVRELESWIKHNDVLLNEWGMEKKLKPGYRVLFYGPPGTGKTLTATLLGKYTGRDVFRIDLSMIVSKYIGETEKNLAALFDKAEHKEWILFFDEADAIFGKRTGVRDAHDKYANQEVSYLLQRVEMHPGLIILASNFKGNIDEAFLRRFNSVVYFPTPDVDERHHLWNNAFPEAVTLQDDVELREIASQYKLTGSHIINAVQYICIEVLERGTYSVGRDDITRAVRRELEKEGK